MAKVCNVLKACGIPASPPTIHKAFHAAGLG